MGGHLDIDVAVVALEARDSLTRHEWAGLEAHYNLADGHSRHDPNEFHQEVIGRLPEIYRAAPLKSQLEVQELFARVYFELSGQRGWRDLSPPLFHYSAWVAIEAVAHVLRERGARVALTHPTFDNIPALLRRAGIPLTPIADGSYRHPVGGLAGNHADTVFMVLPNNPTGRTMTEDVFRDIARACARNRQLLVIDFSFRHFSDLSLWDQYQVLGEEKTSFIAIEDTGKTWPTPDVKTAMLLASPDMYGHVAAVTDDLLLNVSPFTLMLLTEIIAADPTPHWREIAQRNAGRLEEAVAPFGLRAMRPDHPIGVSWLNLPRDVDSTDLCRALNAAGVTVLPGGPFFWWAPEHGRHYIRVATLRPEIYFAHALRQLEPALAGYLNRSPAPSIQRTGAPTREAS